MPTIEKLRERNKQRRITMAINAKHNVSAEPMPLGLLDDMDAALAMLEKYGRHLRECPVFWPRLKGDVAYSCNCGWAEIAGRKG